MLVGFTHSYFKIRRGILYRDHGLIRIKGLFDADCVRSSVEKKSTTVYCVFLGCNLISQGIRKRMVAHSSVEYEYRDMAQFINSEKILKPEPL